MVCSDALPTFAVSEALVFDCRHPSGCRELKRAHSSKSFVICLQTETYFLPSGGVGNGFPAHLLRSPSPSRQDPKK
nr:MAG TPA: hypothetical protein [Caudoviricetes sp.]